MDKNQHKYNNKSVEEKLVEFKMLAIVLCAAIIVTGFIGGVCGYKLVRKERNLLTWQIL